MSKDMIDILVLSKNLELEKKIKYIDDKLKIKTSIMVGAEEIKNVKVLFVDENFNEYIISLKEEIIINGIITVLISDLSKFKEVYKSLGDKKELFSYLKHDYDEFELEVILDNVKKLLKNKSDLELKDAQIKALINNTPYMTWVKDLESRYLNINKAFASEVAVELSEFDNIFDEDIFEKELSKRFREQDLNVINSKKQIMTEEILNHGDKYKLINTYKSPIIDKKGDVKGSVGIAVDVTEVKSYDFKLDVLIENMPFAIFLKDADGKILKGNGKFFDYYKSNIEKFRDENGNTFSGNELLSYVKREDEFVLFKKSECNFERKLYIDDNFKVLEVHKKPILDIKSNKLMILGVYLDVTEEKNYSNKIEKLVYKDFLTELNNRRSLYEYIEDLRERSLNKFGAMVIDLNNFKNINEVYGHSAGDNALKFIGEELKKWCEDAFLSRSGGDEFIVIYEDITEEAILKRAKDIINSISRKVRDIKDFASIALNIGVATNNNLITIEEILSRADFALSKAKKLGENNVILYDDLLDQERKFDLALEKDLIKGFENNEVELYYQPQYNIKKEVIGLEALFRWNNEKYKNVPVIKLIKKIEEGNLVNKLGEYILRKAIKFSKKINLESDNIIPIFINISAIQLMDSDFCDNFKNIINELNCKPEIIGIELTETVLLDNIDSNIEKLKTLKDLGIKIALDDFGTGYSSLNYLTKLPINKVKLDKSFIRKMNTGKKYIELVNLIIDICHSLDMSVVAEGVETEYEFNILEELGAEYIQGYLLSKPIPEQDILNLVV